ncbi:MAG: hypoxanthine phosphoribosyltransferase [Eubacteriales bacterium]
MEQYKSDIQEVLYDKATIAQRVAELGAVISRDYQGKEVVLVAVLRGSFVFLADLCRHVDLDCTVEFMSVSSYGSGTSSTGQVQITKDLSCDISGKHILLIEDIMDSGNTLSYLFNMLKQREPASLQLCALLDNPARRQQNVEVSYCGFQIPNAFVVGYGLDYAQRYRNLPYIGILKPEVYEK